LHIGSRRAAQQVLFDDNPPPDSRVAGLKRLAKASTPEEQARAIVESKIPLPHRFVGAAGDHAEDDGGIDRADVATGADQQSRTVAAPVAAGRSQPQGDDRPEAGGGQAPTSVSAPSRPRRRSRAVPLDADTRQKLEGVSDAQIKARTARSPANGFS